MPKPLELIGKKFGRLKVLKKVDNIKNGQTYWLCKCDCGENKIVRGTHLKLGKIRSCGCLLQETASKNFSIHKLSTTRLYYIYNGMKGRCYNVNNIEYKNYGGRGIRVCEEWKNDFMSFYNWAITNGYKEDLTIDRIDVNGNYEPNNCRWATRKEQSNNTRRCIFITYNKITHTIEEWGRIFKINSETIRKRLKKYKNNLDIVFYKGNLKELKNNRRTK